MTQIQFSAPTSVDDAIRQLADGGNSAKILAGGTDLLGQFLVDRIVKSGYTYSRLAVQGSNRWGRFGKHGSSAPKGEHFLRVPTICLLDEGTFSTADNVAACLEDEHADIRFVGRPNGAGTGAPRSFELPRTGTPLNARGT